MKTLTFLNESGAIAKVGGWELAIDSGELNWTDETFHIFEMEKKVGKILRLCKEKATRQLCVAV